MYITATTLRAPLFLSLMVLALTVSGSRELSNPTLTLTGALAHRSPDRGHVHNVQKRFVSWAESWRVSSPSHLHHSQQRHRHRRSHQQLRKPFCRAPRWCTNWCTRASVQDRGSQLLRVLPANQSKNKEPTSGLEPLTCSSYEFACARSSPSWSVR